MHAIVLAAMLAGKPPISPDASACQTAQSVTVAAGKPPAPRSLDQMPDARLMRAVLLTVGPCAAVEERVANGSGARVWRIRPMGVASRYVAPAVPGTTSK